jgi:hypothetical protein
MLAETPSAWRHIRDIDALGYAAHTEHLRKFAEAR